MPRKEERLIYKFEELSEEAKGNAIDHYKEQGWDWDEHDTKMLEEFFQEELDTLGLPGGDIRWRLNYSQGDGVAFYGKVDVTDYIQKNKLEDFEPLIRAIKEDEAEIIIEIEKRQAFHMYDHWNTMIVESQANTYDDPGVGGRKRWPVRVGRPAIERLTRELRQHIQAHVKEVSRKLEKAGYEEIEYKSSDAVISENITANDYEFDEDGNFV